MEIYLRYFYFGYLILSVIYLYFVFTKNDRVKGSKVSFTEYIVLGGLILFGLLIPNAAFWYAPEFSFAVPESLQQGGLVLILISIFLLLRTFKDLGKQYTPTLQIFEYHGLITSGIYKYVRHPMYLTAFLILIAQSLLMPNQIGVGSNVITALILLFLRIPAEEKMLIQEFDMEYKKYMERTAGIIPYLY